MIKEQRQMPKKALISLPFRPLLNQCARASATEKNAKNYAALLALHSLRCYSVRPLICPFRTVRPSFVSDIPSARSFVRAIPFSPHCPLHFDFCANIGTIHPVSRFRVAHLILF
ncbi:hypothetical protein niasHT_040008 [Heterodera trifolii]|uniref:Uncharacterized protein n=1 Tax=Heterodera trifolii TaxID=157864 RepID=A0ABD2J5V3_9BILA